MSNCKSSLAVLTVLFALAATPQAFATVAKTYMSRTGTDAGTCPNISPCVTFAYAIGQTSAGGEISVIDSGEYGPVTISQSISIVAEGAEGGITVGSGGTGITINASGINVRLRGLTIDGSVGGGAGLGIAMSGGSSLDLQHCVLRGFNTAVSLSNSAAASLHAEDVLITDSYYGINLSPSYTGVTFADLTRVRIEGAGNTAVIADSATSNGNAAQIQVEIRDSVFASSAAGVAAISLGPYVGGVTVISLSDSHSVGNQYGVYTVGPQSVAILDRTTIQASTVQALYTSAGGAVYSYGNNPINDNAAPGTSPTVIGPH